MVLTWPSAAFVLLHHVRKEDVTKETSWKRCWQICKNHCRSSDMFSCKSSVSGAFRPGSWSKQPSCRGCSFSKHRLYSSYLEVVGGVQRCPVHRQLCQLHSSIGGAEKSGRFQEKEGFTSVWQSWEETWTPWRLGQACSNMSLSNKDKEGGKRSLKIDGNAIGFAVKLLLVHWTAWAKEGNSLGNKV